MKGAVASACVRACVREAGVEEGGRGKGEVHAHVRKPKEQESKCKGSRAARCGTHASGLIGGKKPR